MIQLDGEISRQLFFWELQQLQLPRNRTNCEQGICRRLSPHACRGLFLAIVRKYSIDSNFSLRHLKLLFCNFVLFTMMLGRASISIKPSASAKSSLSHASKAVRSSQSLKTPARRFFCSSLSQASRRPSPAIYRATPSSYRAFSTTDKMATSTRTETDAFGPIEVSSDKYWGAQTQRSLGNFKINQPQDRMPEGVVRAFGILKGAAATVNMRYGLGECRGPCFRPSG